MAIIILNMIIITAFGEGIATGSGSLRSGTAGRCTRKLCAPTIIRSTMERVWSCMESTSEGWDFESLPPLVRVLRPCVLPISSYHLPSIIVRAKEPKIILSPHDHFSLKLALLCGARADCTPRMATQSHYRGSRPTTGWTGRRVHTQHGGQSIVD